MSIVWSSGHTWNRRFVSHTCGEGERRASAPGGAVRIVQSRSSSNGR